MPKIRILRIAIIFCLNLLFINTLSSSQQNIRLLDFQKTFDPDTIWLQGSGMPPETSTITLHATTTGEADTLLIGSRADVVLVLDNSGSMRNGSRLQAAIDASKEFIDNMSSYDRVAYIKYGRWDRGELDTVNHFTDSAQFQTVKNNIDATMDGSGSGTAVWYSTLKAAQYAVDPDPHRGQHDQPHRHRRQGSGRRSGHGYKLL
jgi:hypothetical protein